MYGKLLAAMPGVLDDGGVADVGHLLDDVQLAEAVDAFFFSSEGGQVLALLVIEVADGA
ncbi:hypothetical protein D3C72_2549940 [compost metagenome]